MDASEFPQAEDVIYLNHAGVGPWPRRTADAVQRFADENVRYGARHYARWVEREAQLKERLRALVNAPSTDDIALVKSTSEGLSMVAHGLDWAPGDNVVVPDCEFPSNRIVWESLVSMGVEARLVPLPAADPEAGLVAAMDSRTRLLAVSSVQYADGLRMDLERLGHACHERGVLFCVDAIQSLGALPFDAAAVRADFVVADGHKWMLGPEGLALFFTREDARNKLTIKEYGWHMVEHHQDFDRKDWTVTGSARRFECGSPNMLGVHALDASLSLLQERGMGAVGIAVLANAQALIERIDAAPDLELVTPRTPGRFAGIVSFRHRRDGADAVHRRLTAAGVHCALRGGAVRFSPHYYLDNEQLAHAVRIAEHGIGK